MLINHRGSPKSSVLCQPVQISKHLSDLLKLGTSSKLKSFLFTKWTKGKLDPWLTTVAIQIALGSTVHDP